MKKNFLFLCLASLLSGSAAFAQTVTTDPVGFINETVTGAVGGSPRYTFLSPTLTNPIAFQGTIATITSTTITITGASFTANQFNGANGSYYVEVFSATKPGALANVTATASNGVTVDTNLTSFASAGDSVRIRQHITLGQLLGANNTYGFQSGDGSNLNAVDTVLVYDGLADQAETTYFYFAGDGTAPAGWMDSGFNDYPNGSSGRAIAPSEGVIIQRVSAGDKTIISTGTVKTGNTFFPIYPGTNVIGTVSAQGLTLGNSGLYKNDGSALHAFTGGASDDQVMFWDAASSTLRSYVYFPGDGTAAPGWMDTGFNDYPAGDNNVAIPPGVSFMVVRNIGAAFNWVLPSPTSF